MASPASGPYGTPLLDDFNRPGTTSPPSASWSNGWDAAVSLETLQLANDSASVFPSNAVGPRGNAWWRSAPFPAQQVLWLVLGAQSAGAVTRLHGRILNPHTQAASGYELGVTQGSQSLIVRRWNEGSISVILSNAADLLAAPVAGDALALALLGTVSPVTLECWYWQTSSVGWAKLRTVTDDFSNTPPANVNNFLSAGYIGCQGTADNTLKIDAFGGGPIIRTGSFQ